MEISIEDKFIGALTGCAVGDALGAPVEGMPADSIRAKYGKVTDFLDERFGSGRITDDTQMTVCLTQSILELGNFDAEHAASRFALWIANSDAGIKEARGVGMACATACRRLRDGAGPENSGVDSAGCGAAMRAAPVGLRYYRDPGKMRSASISQALITHTNPEAVAGAAAVAFAVGLGINDDGEIDRPSFLRSISRHVARIDRNMSAKIAGLSDYLDAAPQEGFSYTGNGGYVMETVPAALFAFLQSPYHLEETVITAVNAGGDTESIGAMAGAVSGSFNGVESIPDRWRDNVEGRDYLQSLGFRLYTLTPDARLKRKPLD
jgi:ADP-ribosylglycohydrolase